MAEEREYLARVEAAGVDDLIELLRRPTDDEDKALRAHFGTELYQQLRSLALRRNVSRGLREPQGNVVIIHCFMGSNLSSVDPNGKVEKIWIDAYQLMQGQFDRLRLSEDGRTNADPTYDIRVTGMMKRQYGELLLALAENWNVRAFWYDWRKDTRLAATQLEARLSDWFGDTDPIHLVAHGEGGVVARTFIKNSPERWAAMWDKDGNGRRGGRLIMLGTANHGSFVIPQVLTGLSHLVTEMDMLDTRNERLGVLNVVNSFAGLYQMLPSPLIKPALEGLYRAETYQALNLPISQRHLDNARRQHNELQPVADPARMIAILGDAHPTLSQLADPRRVAERAAYEVSTEGDGYVTHELSELRTPAGQPIPSYYVNEIHGNLVTNSRVLRALDDLLETGQTDVLGTAPQTPPGTVADDARRAAARMQLEAEHKADMEQIEVMLRRIKQRDSSNNASAYVAAEQRKVEGFLTRDILCYRETDQPVTRPVVPFPPTRIEIVLLHASIVDLDTALPNVDPPVDALAMGQYRGVRPYSAMLALDQAISKVLSAEGAMPADAALSENRHLLTQYIERGIIRGELGQPFFLPDPRQPARLLAIAGMGLPGRFGAPELTVLARELCWSLGRLGKRHLATILIGAGNGNLTAREAVGGWIRGIKLAVTGSRDDEQHHLRRITFVEYDPHKVIEIDRVIIEEQRRLKEEKRLLIDYTPLSEAQHLELEEAGEAWELARRRAERRRRRGEQRGAETTPTRVTITLEGDTYRFGAITENASIPERDIPLDQRLVITANDELAAEWDPQLQRERGQFLEGLLIPDDLREDILTNAPLVMVLDSTTARIHWEMLARPDQSAFATRDDDRSDGALRRNADGDGFQPEAFLGTSRGFTRQLRSSLAPPDAPPPRRRLLRVLVIADPAADAHLPGAEEEGAAVADLFEAFNTVYEWSENRVEVVRLFGPREATRTIVLRYLMTRSYDVLHFAGHCTYDKNNPHASGWIFTGGERLTANEMNRIDRVPNFVFSNACESGITPDRSEERTAALAPSFAEAFFARGVTNFVCTAWPIADLAAREFGLTLYERLLGLERDPDRHGRYRPITPEPMHSAMRAARCQIATTLDGARTWGAYQHYGNPYFRFFDPTAMRQVE